MTFKLIARYIARQLDFDPTCDLVTLLIADTMAEQSKHYELSGRISVEISQLRETYHC